MVNTERQTGFTLLELMIVVTIVGILAVIAYPSYTEYVKKSRRSDAKTGLLDLQLAQEKYRTNCIQYATGIGSDYVCDTSAGTYTLKGTASSPEGYYALSILAGADATNYTLQATRNTNGLQSGDKCGDFQINQDGEKTVINAASGYDATKCW